MTVYLTEKPSQIEPLAKALKANNMLDKDTKIVSLLGHILRMMEFKEIDEEFKNRSWNSLVKSGKVPFFYDNPFSIKWKKVSNAKVFKEVKETIEKANRIILATDPDNEGATLGLEVIEKCNALNKVVGMVNMNKLDIASLSKEVRKIDKLPYLKMYDAGRSRAIADQLFGFNVTILATELFAKKFGEVLNVGAVKLPTIRMVVERDLKFESHKKIPYYVMTGKAQAKGKIFDVKFEIDKDKIESREEADRIKKTILANPSFVVESFKEQKKSEAPPKPYSLTDLQSEANKKFKFTAQKVLKLAQSLYETHNVQSYPRTDNNYYAEGEYLQAPTILRALSSVGAYEKLISKLDLNNLLKRKIFDDSKITAHTALAPTQEARLDKLKNINEDEKKIFHLVATRYIMQFYPDYEYLNISGQSSNIEGIKAVFSENIPMDLGWREVVDRPEKRDRTIPKLQNGDTITILADTIKIEEKFTKPKPRFTESTLLKAMERVHTIFDDEEVKKLLKDSGIGTPATRASILEDLKRKDKSGQAYFVVEKGKIISTQKARDLIAKIPDEISSPKVRAYIERRLREIEAGNLTKEEFYQEFKGYIEKISKELLSKYEIREMEKREVKETGLQCPLCGGNIVEKEKIFSCENRKYDSKNKSVDGCKFFILKTGKFISFDQNSLKKLLSGEVVENEKVKAKLDLNNDFFVKTEFKTSSNSNDLVETAKTYRLGDKFVFKEFRGKKLTKNQAKKLLQGEEVILTRKSQKGNEYKLKCRLIGNKIVTEFA